MEYFFNRLSKIKTLFLAFFKKVISDLVFFIKFLVQKIRFSFSNISIDIYFISLILLFVYQIIISINLGTFFYKAPTFMLMLFFILQFSQKSLLEENIDVFGQQVSFKKVRFFCVFMGLFGFLI